MNLTIEGFAKVRDWRRLWLGYKRVRYVIHGGVCLESLDVAIFALEVMRLVDPDAELWVHESLTV